MDTASAIAAVDPAAVSQIVRGTAHTPTVARAVDSVGRLVAPPVGVAIDAIDAVIGIAAAARFASVARVGS